MRFRAFFEDKEKNIVIGQKPNWPMYVALGFFLLRFTPLEVVSKYGVAASMLYWSFLEIFSGVNPWRRFLGTMVALFILITL